MDKRFAHVGRQTADDAKVDISDRIGWQRNKVGRMQIRMEIAVYVDLIQQVPTQAPRDGFYVDSIGRKFPERRRVPIAARGQDLVKRWPIEQLGGQHPSR